MEVNEKFAAVVIKAEFYQILQHAQIALCAKQLAFIL